MGSTDWRDITPKAIPDHVCLRMDRGDGFYAEAWKVGDNAAGWSVWRPGGLGTVASDSGCRSLSEAMMRAEAKLKEAT